MFRAARNAVYGAGLMAPEPTGHAAISLISSPGRIEQAKRPRRSSVPVCRRSRKKLAEKLENGEIGLR